MGGSQVERGAACRSDLLEKAIAGDEEALSSLIEHHGPLIRERIARRIPRRFRSVLSADDVMQQTYMDALVAIRRVDPTVTRCFEAWLMMLAECNLTDAERMLGAKKRGGGHRRVDNGWNAGEPGPSPLDALPKGATTVSGKAARQEANGALNRALAQLPLTYRRVIEMCDLQQQPVAEVASALECSHGAVYMRRARARDMLHEIMGRTSKFFSKKA